MVRAGLKGKKLGKEKKLELIAARKKAMDSKRSRDDSKWKRVLAKMSDDKKKKYIGVGNTGKKARTRGVTRRSLRKAPAAKSETLTTECTIHLSKLLCNKTFNKRAPLAVKKIKKFAAKMMKTKDNRIDASLNTFLWSKGVKGVPGRVRVRLERKTAPNEKGKHYYTVISNISVPSFKGLKTTPIRA